MKKLTFIIFLVCAHNVSAQNHIDNKVDTLKLTSWGDLTNMYNNPFYIIDDKPINDSLQKDVLNNLNPADVTEITILKEPLNTGIRNTINIVTKDFAIAQYQKKLSSFSQDYKREVEFQMKYNHNDKGIFYHVIINEAPIFFTKDDMIRELYDIPASKIKKVELHLQQTCCGINKYVDVSINK
jgi:hypothetical protein